MNSRRCVLAGCWALDEHADDCAGGRCKGCLPRVCERGIVCNSHRVKLAAELGELSALDAELREEPDPVDGHEWTVRQWRPIPTTNPDRKAPWAWVREAGEDVLARILPMGITRTSHQARVSGSKEQPAVANLDLLDLTAPARQGSIEIVGNPNEHPDQIGHLSITTELDFWVRDWIETRDMREHLPVPTVPVLVSWLGNRLDWACDEHPGIDEFAAKVSQLRHAVRGVLGLNTAPKERCHGIACRSCDRMSLFRDSGYVTCGNCGLYYSDKDYNDWVGLLAGQARRIAA